MNDLDYLNSISSSNNQRQKTPFLDKKMKTILFALVGAVVLTILVILIVPLATPQESTPTSDLSLVYLRASSLETTVSTYNSQISSPSLRAAGATLSTSLTDLSTRTLSILSTSYGIKSVSPLANETAILNASTSKLENARLNGLLDRTYASEVSYQISRLLLAETDALAKVPSSSTTANYLKSSYDSLSLLYETFSSYSQ